MREAVPPREREVQGPLPASRDDAALVARMRAGDELAYEELVRAHTARLLGVARRILASDEDAREVVQETFVAALRALDGFKGDARLSTWLHRIAVNSALMRLRSRRRRPEEPIEPLLPAFKDDGHHQEKFRSWSEPADEAMDRARRRELVRACIAQLPDSYRTVLLLRDIEEMDTPEVAAMMGLTPNAVKIRVHRARQALRTLLDPHFREARP
jgi:RNA polymerase sigma-70 factor (ECF subfamily)